MKKQTITRREFLKGTVAGALGLAVSSTMGFTASAEEPAGIYIPGTYSATATGIGTVTVTMTFDADSITDVQIDTSGETEGIGKGLAPQFQEQILARQGAEIDAVSGASTTSGAVKQAAEACIAQAQGKTVELGQGAAAGQEPAWRQAPDPIPENELSETFEADIAIVGCGYAGLSTARAALEGGLKVAIVESMQRDSWWTVGHDLGHINSSLQKKHGVPEVDPVEFYNNWMMMAHYKANPDLVMQFARNSGSAIDWYLDPVSDEVIDACHMLFFPDNEHTIHQLNNGMRFYGGVPQWWQAQWENGPRTADNNTPGKLELKDLSEANLEYIEQNYGGSLQEFFGCKGSQLVMDGEKVIGVIAKKADGSYIKVLAAKGVVLSGGGFAHNKEMCEDLLVDAKRSYLPGDDHFGNFAGRDGSTIQMGYWAGGHLEGEPSSMNFDTAAIPDSLNGPLWINGDGERFQNEAAGGPEISGLFMARAMRGGYCTSVFDNTLDDQLVSGYGGHGALNFSDEDEVRYFRDAFHAAEGKGAEGANDYYCADTLEELADYIGVDRKVFLKTIENYNAICEKGVDTDFGKDPHFLIPVKNAPFYAHKTLLGNGFALVTTGAFVTTKHQQVVNDYFKPIDGLYASGNTCGMRFGPTYITPICGVSIGMAITLGRELGTYLAAL